MKFISYSLSIIVLLIFVNCQQKKVRDATNDPKAAKDTLVYSIDTAFTKLPKDFSAIKPIILFDSLSRISYYLPFKGEYETTEEYKARSHNFIDSVLNKPIVSNLTLNSLYVIGLDHGLWLSYNADKGIMNLSITFEKEYSDYPNYFEEDELKHKYEASAVLSIVTKSFDAGKIQMNDELWIKFENLNKNKMKNYFKETEGLIKKLYKFELPLKMDREYARQEKNNFRMLAIIKLVKPWYKYWYDATRESYFLINQKAIMYTEIVQLWIYNYKTGEIYFKIKA